MKPIQFITLRVYSVFTLNPEFMNIHGYIRLTVNSFDETCCVSETTLSALYELLDNMLGYTVLPGIDPFLFCLLKLHVAGFILIT